MPHLAAGGRGRMAVGAYIAWFPRYWGTCNSRLPRYRRIAPEMTPLYRVEAMTSSFDPAKVEPFAIQATAISRPRQ